MWGGTTPPSCPSLPPRPALPGVMNPPAGVHTCKPKSCKSHHRRSTFNRTTVPPTARTSGSGDPWRKEVHDTRARRRSPVGARTAPMSNPPEGRARVRVRWLRWEGRITGGTLQREPHGALPSVFRGASQGRGTTRTRHKHSPGVTQPGPAPSYSAPKGRRRPDECTEAAQEDGF